MEPAAADPASAWMRHLERAHRLAHEAAWAIEDQAEPSAHLAPAARRLEHGMQALYDAFDGRADRCTAMGAAHARLWDAAILVAQAGLPQALAALRGACGELVAAEQRFPQVPVASARVAPLVAAEDRLPLHALARSSLRPSFRAPPLPEVDEAPAPAVLPEPTTFEELAAVAALLAKRSSAVVAQRRRPEPPARPLPKPAPERPPGFALPPPPALTDDVFVRSWARHCFEEIGMLGVQRAPLAGDDWRTSLPIERRMFHAVHAVAALGPAAVSSLEALALDAPVANPMAIFALSLLGGCLEGRDLLGSAERALHHFGPGDPLVSQAFASAMKLVPSPLLPGMLRSLLASGEPGSKRVAVEVLATRGWLSEAELEALADEEDPRTLALALPALATRRHPAFRRAVDRALIHEDLRLQAAALDALALAAAPNAADAARAAAAGALGDEALVRLALVADLDDARWLLARALASPTPAALEALGWCGLVEAVPMLLRQLEGEGKALKLAAGAALERLLGANLMETIEIQPEEAEAVMLLDPDPSPPRPRASLASLVSDPRDPPQAGSPETLEVASTDAAKWRAHWVANARRFDPTQRLRRGQGYSPSVSLYELDRLPLPPEDRRRLFRELCARTGKMARFDPHDLVRAQEQSIEEWGAVLRASVETPGSWRRAGRAR